MKQQKPISQRHVNESIDLAMIRMRRRKGQYMNQAMGSTTDSLEAQMNELELAIALLTSQSGIERQKAEALAEQLTIQIKTAEDKLLSFLNAEQKKIYDSVYGQVKISEDTLKFKGTDVYDLSFIRNFDYSKVTTFNDADLMQNRTDNREKYRQEMKDHKTETQWYIGLIANTDKKEYPSIYNELVNSKHYHLKQYYLSAIKFYQEATVIGFLLNPTNNISNLKDFIFYNETNLKKNIEALDFKRLELGEEKYKLEKDKFAYLDRMVKTAKARLKYLEKAYEGLWIPPTLETLEKYATDNNTTFSKAVYELNAKTRSTLCVPDWILGIAEMYNMVQKFEEPMTELNPYDARWIRKAKEVVNLESKGVKYTAEKLFEAIDRYWEALCFGFQEIENQYIDLAIEYALKEDATKPVPAYSDGLRIINFDDDIQQMSGPLSLNAKYNKERDGITSYEDDELYFAYKFEKGILYIVEFFINPDLAGKGLGFKMFDKINDLVTKNGHIVNVIVTIPRSANNFETMKNAFYQYGFQTLNPNAVEVVFYKEVL